SAVQASSALRTEEKGANQSPPCAYRSAVVACTAQRSGARRTMRYAFSFAERGGIVQMPSSARIVTAMAASLPHVLVRVGDERAHDVRAVRRDPVHAPVQQPRRDVWIVHRPGIATEVRPVERVHEMRRDDAILQVRRVRPRPAEYIR